MLLSYLPCLGEGRYKGHRLGSVPRVRVVLDALPSKVLVLRSGRPTEPCVASTGELADRVERVPARIAGATYTGKGDKGHGARPIMNAASRAMLFCAVYLAV